MDTIANIRAGLTGSKGFSPKDFAPTEKPIHPKFLMAHYNGGNLCENSLAFLSMRTNLSAKKQIF